MLSKVLGLTALQPLSHGIPGLVAFGLDGSGEAAAAAFAASALSRLK